MSSLNQVKALNIPSRKKQQGFTLLEVLVTVFVLAIGLLGLASLQAVGQRNNNVAYLRTQAILQAYDMSERMRANQVGIDNDDYDNITTTIPADPGCINAGCTPAQIAQYDAFTWNTTNANTLPSGEGTVTFNPLPANSFSIVVNWDDDQDGDVDADDPNFTWEFRP